MNTVENLTSEAEAIKERLSQIEHEKQAAKDAERRDKVSQVEQLGVRAKAYRDQAVKTTSEADKLRLYENADECERNADELRIELGLVSEEQVQATTNERNQAEFDKTSRKINALLFKALFCFGVYLLTDFTAGQLQLGFVCYVLTSIAKVFHTLFFAFGGIWLVCKLLFYFVSNYTYTGLKTDFKTLTPGYRVAILAALMASVFIFLSGVISHN